MAQWSVDNGIVTTDEPVSFDRYIRGIVTGDWSNAEHERALSEGPAPPAACWFRSRSPTV